MTPLIDATEMYLRTIWELEEEGITPIRARLVERLGLTAPAVSETVSKLAAEGLLKMTDERTLELSPEGREIAISVMRKHRLAELLLTEVIGLEWEQVHTEACRWEHVISDAVEQRLIALLDNPSTCPHGNPIPGLSETTSDILVTMLAAAGDGRSVTIRRISERLQGDPEQMRWLRTHELIPGTGFELHAKDDVVVAEHAGHRTTVPIEIAELVYVSLD